MRQVLFKPILKGVKLSEIEYTEVGIFHQWGNSFIEFEEGPGNITVGIIELPDGRMIEVEVSRIKFIEPA